MNYVLSLRIRYHALIRSYKKQDSVLAEAFGNHVHWGFWPEPETAGNSLESFLKAADRVREKIPLQSIARPNGLLAGRALRFRPD